MLSPVNENTPLKKLAAFWSACKVSHQWILYLLAALLGISNFVFINATQTQVLAQLLRIPSSELGDKSGSLAFIDQLASLVAVYVFGLVSDFIGRQVVYSVGFLLMGIAICVYPWLPNYGAMIGGRLLFACGGSAASSMIIAVLADYAEDKFRGRLAGLVGLCSGSGALLALFLFMPLPFRFDNVVTGLKSTYLLVGLISIAFSVLLALFLSPSAKQPSRTPLSSPNDVNAPRNSTELQRQSNESGSSATSQSGLMNRSSWDSRPGLVTNTPTKSVWQTATEGVFAAKDPKVLLGYVGSFLARGDTVIITLFIPLWVYKRSIELGQCDPPGGTDDPDIRDVCAAAFKRASAISGVAQTFALVGAPLFGYLSDGFHASYVVLLNAIVGCVAYFCMFTADPMQGYVFAIAVFVGLSEIGLVIGNMSLVTDSASVHESVRGSVAGVSSACGAVGILLSSKLGGWLFDNWREGAPFLVLAVGHLGAVLVGVYVVLTVTTDPGNDDEIVE